MIAISTRRFLGLTFVVVLCVAAANIAVSQVPTVGAKGKVKTYRELVLTVASGETTQISDPSWTDGLVPGGRKFVVTDVIINNVGLTTMFNARIIRDGDAANAPAFSIPGESTFAHAFATGMQFAGGSMIECRNTGPAAAIFVLTGYEFK